MRAAEVDLGIWFGVFGPKGMPNDVKAKLEQAIAGVVSDPRVRERLARLDITPGFAPAPVLWTKLESEIRNWTTFIDSHGIRPE